MRKIIALLAVAVIACLLASCLSGIYAQDEPPLWDRNYRYAAKINIQTPIVGYQYQIRLNTTKLILEGKLKPDCSDLRIVRKITYTPNYYELQEVDRWIDESSPCNRPITRIWFKYLGGDYYIYYGNPNASNPPENPYAIFEYFDSFKTNTTSHYVRDFPDYWTSGNLPQVTWQYDKMILTVQGIGSIRTAAFTVSRPFAVRIYYKSLTPNNPYAGVFVFLKGSYEHVISVGLDNNVKKVSWTYRTSSVSTTTVIGTQSFSSNFPESVMDVYVAGGEVGIRDPLAGVVIYTSSSFSDSFYVGFGTGYFSTPRNDIFSAEFYYILVRKVSVSSGTDAAFGTSISQEYDRAPQTTTTTTTTTETTATTTQTTQTTTTTTTEATQTQVTQVIIPEIPIPEDYGVIAALGFIIGLSQLFLQLSARR